MAYALSFAAGIAFSAVINPRIVFLSRLIRLTTLRFAVFHCTLSVVGLDVTVALVDLFGAPARIAPVGTAVLLQPISFLASRLALTSKRSSLVNHFANSNGTRQLLGPSFSLNERGTVK
ncbi:GtrA family protein [Bradyrhizobium sp. S69]|uniref:GtrA family protein n=1 Tax=Bradyrhizobium sp. S69 TaxID=1641856 RepID=UPI00131ABB71|nr:GtrA family protein [Bradyrhizobium sp. S69]